MGVALAALHRAPRELWAGLMDDESESYNDDAFEEEYIDDGGNESSKNDKKEASPPNR